MSKIASRSNVLVTFTSTDLGSYKQVSIGIVSPHGSLPVIVE